MIISHKHKFIFIKTHKTAGSSLEMALANICGPEDIITRLYFEDGQSRKKLGYKESQNYYFPFRSYTLKDWLQLIRQRKRQRFKHHNSAKIIKSHIPDEVWNTYYRFCFERNPYDKIISWYYWNNRKTGYDIDTFLEKKRTLMISEVYRYYLNKKLAVDKVYAYEKLDEALIDITEKLDLTEPLKMPEYRAKGNVRKDRRDFKEVLNKNQIKIINDIFDPVFELMGYEKIMV